jgi:proline iminopeptidase
VRTEHATRPQPDIDLASNTTPHLIADIERLREHLDIERWLVWGGSWGSTLALAYAESHPARVTEMILWGITTGRRVEADWLFRGGVSPLFPEQWANLRAALPAGERDGDIVEAYSAMLHDRDPDVRRRAAVAWCTWESATPDWPPNPTRLAKRYEDPDFALAFARLVTHYVRHDDFLEDGILLRDAHLLVDIPGVLVNGRFDLQAPVANAWELGRAWPYAELVIVTTSRKPCGRNARRLRQEISGRCMGTSDHGGDDDARDVLHAAIERERAELSAQMKAHRDASADPSDPRYARSRSAGETSPNTRAPASPAAKTDIHS